MNLINCINLKSNLQHKFIRISKVLEYTYKEKKN